MNKSRGIKFFPYYFFEITLVALFTVEAALLLAVLFPTSVGREIDFSSQYSPRPEWYFLFLYQLTKYFPGRWTFVGAILLPGLTFSVLLLAPFLDNSAEQHLGKRRVTVAIGFGMLAAIVGLTVASLI